MRKFRLKNKYKITIIKDRKTKVLRFNDLMVVETTLRILGLKLGPQKISRLVNMRRSSDYSTYYGNSGEIAFVESRTRSIDLVNAP